MDLTTVGELVIGMVHAQTVGEVPVTAGPGPLTFSWNISFGLIIQTLAFLGGAIAFIKTAHSTQVLMSYRLTHLEDLNEGQQTELAKINDTLGRMSDQARRIDAAERLIDELRRGDGYIKARRSDD